MKTYVVDIDGTICSLTDGDYSQAKPIFKRIDKINNLFEQGNRIVFHTARGMGRTNNNPQKAKELFYDLTEKQLDSWGVKFHELWLGKPSGDLYIDDKGVSDNEFFTN